MVCNSFVGIVCVKLVAAYNLRKSDMLGKADPYALIRVGSDHQEKSEVGSGIEHILNT